MHAFRPSWLSPLAGTCCLLAGCHAPMILPRPVQVSQRPHQDSAPIDPPPQRLATSRESADGPGSSGILASLSDRSGHETRTAAAPPDAGPATVEARTPTSPEWDSLRLPAAADATQWMAAFSDSPPEVQELALRQLIAVAARNAHSTGRPSEIESVLRRALDETAGPNPQPQDSGVSMRLADRPAEDTAPPTTLSGKDTPAAIVAATATQDPTPQHPNPAEMRLAGRQEDHAESNPNPSIRTVAAVEAAAPLDPLASPDDANDPADDGNIPERVSRPESPRLATADPADASDADRSLASAEPLTEQELLDQLLELWGVVSHDATDAQRHRREIMARYLMVLAGDPDTAVTAIEGLSEGEQEFLRHQLLALWTLVDEGGHPVIARRFASALPQLREATKHLAASTDSLEIRSLAFCTEIEAYGQIKEFDRGRFRAGQEVILYCEIENFASQRGSDGYETHLQGSYSVYDQNNRKISSQLLPADKQISRNYLRDYFIAYQMPLPKNLETGKYRLELTMEDVHGQKYGQASIPFEIAR